MTIRGRPHQYTRLKWVAMKTPGPHSAAGQTLRSRCTLPPSSTCTFSSNDEASLRRPGDAHVHIHLRRPDMRLYVPALARYMHAPAQRPPRRLPMTDLQQQPQMHSPLGDSDPVKNNSMRNSIALNLTCPVIDHPCDEPCDGLVCKQCIPAWMSMLGRHAA